MSEASQPIKLSLESFASAGDRPGEVRARLALDAREREKGFCCIIALLKRSAFPRHAVGKWRNRLLARIDQYMQYRFAWHH